MRCPVISLSPSLCDATTASTLQSHNKSHPSKNKNHGHGCGYVSVHHQDQDYDQAHCGHWLSRQCGTCWDCTVHGAVELRGIPRPKQDPIAAGIRDNGGRLVDDMDGRRGKGVMLPHTTNSLLLLLLRWHEAWQGVSKAGRKNATIKNTHLNGHGHVHAHIRSCPWLKPRPRPGTRPGRQPCPQRP